MLTTAGTGVWVLSLFTSMSKPWVVCVRERMPPLGRGRGTALWMKGAGLVKTLPGQLMIPLRPQFT